MIEQLRYLFSPGKDILKITSDLKMGNFNNLQEGMTDVVIFAKGYLQIHLDLIFTKGRWQVIKIKSEK